ncbi:hypothetical protein [Caulobacter sp. BE254]|uniref:hypothetical protein n=1 Tax=Caulobacter sp. BE254 TaxID=2817720 RepID=UPI00285E9C25|nr:hypothetical protein [Caulobacter sp. BE254]MDR7114863.1 hypothetical protein [Caulobacter sp. BE254]
MNVAFDTLSASKRLRDAGLEERAAEAIVELVQSAAHFPDVCGLATRIDIADMATKADFASMATKADIADIVRKADIADMATKADLADLASTTKMDIQGLKADLAITKNQILAELNDKLRFQSFALMGGVTAIVGLATAILKLGP